MPNHLGESEIDIASTEDALFSRVALFANPRKTDYLGYRACNFSVREACNLVPISLARVLEWRREDPEFARYEMNIGELQRDLGPTIIRMDFIRNVKLFLKIDFRILWKAAAMGLDIGTTFSEGEAILAGLTTREFEYICKVRKEYGPAAMLALHKALEPVPGEEDKGMLDRVVVIVDGEVIEGEAARAAAGKALLDQFKRNKEMLPVGQEESGGNSK